MGGSPEQLPERYAVGDPLALVPLELPVLLVHGVLDETVSIELSRRYTFASDEAGGEVELIEIEGTAGRHRAHIDPGERLGGGGAVAARAAQRLSPRTGSAPRRTGQDRTGQHGAGSGGRAGRAGRRISRKNAV